MAERLPLMLRAYRRVAAFATPLLPLVTSYRARRGKEQIARIRERRGEASAERPDAPLVWIHAASVGEMLSVIPVIEHLRANDFTVLMTSGTVTSARLAEWRMPPGTLHQFAPYDAPRFVARFLDHWQPDLALFAESDLWPNMITSASARGIPLILINGRLSERSFRRWKRMPHAIAVLLSHFDLCLAQTVRDAERYSELGAPRVTTTGNLKLDVPAPPVDDHDFDEMLAATRQRPVIAAASTHPGEEKIIFDVHRRLRKRFPGLLTIVAPRHAERGVGVMDIARAGRLDAVARSNGHLPGPSAEIYVADTMGELGLLYRVAPVVFIGGSLVRHGGQNPIEAAKLGAAILHGPHVWNFGELYGALDAAEGAVEVTDAGQLAEAFAAWLSNPALRDAAAEAALQTVEGLSGARNRTLAALEPYLLQLRLHYR